MINKCRIGKHVERSGYDLIWDTISAFAFKDWGKPWSASVRIVTVQTEHLRGITRATADTVSALSILEINYTVNDCFLFVPAFGRCLKSGAVRVSLTASHSSTVAEECIALLRSLHGLPGWNQALNHILANKLAVAGDLLTEGPFFRIHQVRHWTKQSLWYTMQKLEDQWFPNKYDRI
jgi:hypothetical protein